MTLSPGLLVLHSNRVERLAETTLAWAARQPLGPLEEELFLVQSNGMAEWLKMSLAQQHGVAAATRVELPARFVWRMYRLILGRAAVPAVSPLDKLPLTWRLMALLPTLVGRAGFEPIAAFLRTEDPLRRFQLAGRLADLFDAYQVYRTDWLQAWEAGREVLVGPRGEDVAMPTDQRWQPLLWQSLMHTLSAEQRDSTRPALHRRFLAALGGGPTRAPLPRRVVLFGVTQLPWPTLEALALLAKHAQVFVALPNPCRFHWADTLEGRELLTHGPRRQPLRGGVDLAALSLEAVQGQGHPLLTAWGRQMRDFVRQWDGFDEHARAHEQLDIPTLDLFDDDPGATLLARVQARIRDLVPLTEHAAEAPWPEGDRSIVFHVAHSAQREVEILHDQLLDLLAHPPAGEALAPRDIVVMVPNVEQFAPAIRSVFGQFGRGHARHIPWGMADESERGRVPVMVALEWLLRVDQHRFTLTELCDLLDVPAVAQRFGIAADDLPLLRRWMDESGLRWGLSAPHREGLGLGASGSTCTWPFALRRMLLGYATGASAGGFAGVEPYDEIGGPSAALVGGLCELLDTLEAWWRAAAVLKAPEAWALCLRALLKDTLCATEADDRDILAALEGALGRWLTACEQAHFAGEIGLSVVREAWLAAYEEPGLSTRFRASGVTFCTLLPMRAIPFEVVCLLGMNDGDYPRRGLHSDFDLMSAPGMARPGDRSRRHDDRQLMLDALLSARRVLYLSWCGRSLRDNADQPPSVLVAQLRDYLAAGWGPAALEARTTRHPLQPFSRKYFEADRPPALLTYAAEWRAALDAHPPPVPVAAGARAHAASDDRSYTLAQLDQFLKNPVKAYFRERLQVSFEELAPTTADDEVFVPDGLSAWKLRNDIVQAIQRQAEAQAYCVTSAELQRWFRVEIACLRREGRMPLAGPGLRAEERLMAELFGAAEVWLAHRAAHPLRHDKLSVQVVDEVRAGLRLDDWLTGLQRGATGPRSIEWAASKVAADKKFSQARADKLLLPWLRCLAAAAMGHEMGGVLIGLDAVVELAPVAQADAADTLRALLGAVHCGLSGDRPTPTALKTGLARLEGAETPRVVFEGRPMQPGEGAQACLARLYPDYDHLAQEPEFEAASRLLYAAYAAWLTSLLVAPLPKGLPAALDEEAQHG